MCGICGELAKKDRKISSNSIELMVDKIRHRGPDDRGVEILSFFTEEDLGIGFSRLSIRDLSTNGHQPMWNLNHDILITFNGEIYNSEELRERYLQTESFNSTSDTEVLLKMYEKFDIDFTLSVLDGMYAICIADLRQKCLFLIRDKLGEKPLYI